MSIHFRSRILLTVIMLTFLKFASSSIVAEHLNLDIFKSKAGLTETIFVFLFTLFIYKVMYTRFGPTRKFKRVPEVPGYSPIVGHIPQLSKDPLGFLDSCYNIYGKIFMIRLGRKKVVILCDKNLLRDFWHSDESKLSFFKFAEGVNINSSFSHTIKNPVIAAIPFIKKAFIGRMSELVQDLNENMEEAFQNYTNYFDSDSELDINEMLNQVFHPAVFKTAFGVPLTPGLRSAYEDFTAAFIKVAYATYILPRFIVNSFLMRKVRSARERYIEIFKPTVQKYFTNEGENPAPLIRHTVDYRHESFNGGRLNETEVCQALLNLHFATVSAPMILCAHIIKQLEERPDMVTYIREELNPDKYSVQEIIKDKVLHAIVMETARLNANIAVQSRATFVHSTVGEYNVGNADIISAAGAQLFEGKAAGETFSNPSQFNPERFLGDNETKEPMDSNSLWIWGAGTHACPGRNVSINEAKLFIVHFIKNFDSKIMSCGPRDYMTFNSILHQNMTVKLKRV